MTERAPREVIDKIMLDWRSSMHTAFPARIVSYDAALQTVDIAPALQREVPTDNPTEPWAFEQLPDPLYNVPVMWPRGGGYAITFPLKAGDWVLVVCAEQSTLMWRQSGDTHEEPGLVDPFGLNGLVALPGWFPDTQKLSGVSTDDLVIGTEDGAAAIRLKPGGTVSLGSDQGDDFVALAQRVEAAIRAAIEGHKHTVTTTGSSTTQSGTTSGGVITDIASTGAEMTRAK